MVLAAYAQNRSLKELLPASGHQLCEAFAFLMFFFGLASTSQLPAMALECWLSRGHPFFYQRHITPRRGVLVAPAFCLAFCALPFAGFGKFVQYCPGTWCFIQMIHKKRSFSVISFSVLYTSLMALLVLATVMCNLGAMYNLLCHAQAPEAPSPPLLQGPRPVRLRLQARVPASFGGARPLCSAGSHNSALHHVFPAFNCELLGYNV